MPKQGAYWILLWTPELDRKDLHKGIIYPKEAKNKIKKMDNVQPQPHNSPESNY